MVHGGSILVSSEVNRVLYFIFNANTLIPVLHTVSKAFGGVGKH